MHQTRFLGLLQAIPTESSVGNEKISVLADWLCFAPWSNFWQFFGRLEDDAILHLPLDRIAPNSVPWGFARHSTPIKRWKRENTSISRLAWFWCSFGAFSAGTKTTLSWAYPWNELQQTRFLGLLQAIPPESGLGKEKIPVLADCPCFPPWSNFWQFFGRLEDDDVLRVPLDGIAPNSVPWAFAGHSTGIWRWKRENTSISRLPLFCSLEQLLAVFRPARRRRCPALTLGPNCTKLGSNGFCTPFHRNLALDTGKCQY